MTTSEKLTLMAEAERRNSARWTASEIEVTFTDGRTATYTTAILSLLKTDPDVMEIMDCQTGELLYYIA